MPVIETVRTKCRDCYKCVRACPVKAIKVERGPGVLEFHASVVEDYCTHCGTCLRECPQGAKKARDDVGAAKALLSGADPVCASLAPSFAAAFPGDPLRVVTALRRLGFRVVQETALGAEMVAAAHKRLLDEGKGPFLSSACPAVVGLVEKHYPEAVPSLAPVVSPAVAHGRYLKSRYPGARVIFVGPCIAKKDEIADPEVAGAVDVVLTFDELRSWLDDQGIKVGRCAPGEFDGPLPDKARSFAADGGLLYAACDGIGPMNGSATAVSGMAACVDMVKHFLSPAIKGAGALRLVEPLACQGGCISGPSMPAGDTFERRMKLIAYRDSAGTGSTAGSTANAAGQASPASELLPPEALRRSFKDKKVPLKQPAASELRAILEKSGKFSPEDELNCGACGYGSCREKAVAVYNGMADPEMCIPHMRQRAESMANLVVGAARNGIIVTSLDGSIVDLNQAAERIIGKRKKDCAGARIADFMDATRFLEAARTRDVARGESRIGDLIVDEEVLYVPDQKLLVGFLSDITRERTEAERRRAAAEEAVDRARQVIERQMSVAQKIAGLLGETTAETKISLTALMKAVREERPSSDGPEGGSSGSAGK